MKSVQSEALQKPAPPIPVNLLPNYSIPAPDLIVILTSDKPHFIYTNINIPNIEYKIVLANVIINRFLAYTHSFFWIVVSELAVCQARRRGQGLKFAPGTSKSLHHQHVYANPNSSISILTSFGIFIQFVTSI